MNKLENNLCLLERKALRACLGVKQGTSGDLLYSEINRPDIVASIYLRQFSIKNSHNFNLAIQQRKASSKNTWN